MAGKNKNVEYIELPDKNMWMTTFSDMVTLLITFFVLLISMSSMDNKKFKNIFGFFNSAFGPLEFVKESAVGGMPSIEAAEVKRLGLDVTSLNRAILNSLHRSGLKGEKGRGQDMFEVRQSRRGVAIVLRNDIMFDKGSARLRPQAIPLLQSVAMVIKNINTLISVEGHSDSTGNSETNWKLSLDRAISVLNYFVYGAGLSPRRFCVAGYGPTRPIADNSTPEGRKKNRRVEIVLLRDRF